MSGSSNFQMTFSQIDPPHLKLPVKGVNSSLIHVINENPFEMVNLEKILRPMNSIVTGHRRGRQCSLRRTPHLKLPVKGVNSLQIHVINENPFEMVNL